MPTPSKESQRIAYERGHQAYKDGLTIRSNPYSARQGKCFVSWDCGWIDAARKSGASDTAIRRSFDRR